MDRAMKLLELPMVKNSEFIIRGGLIVFTLTLLAYAFSQQTWAIWASI